GRVARRTPVRVSFSTPSSPGQPPGVAGDDVDVQVHHRLPDVVAVGVEPFVEEGFCLPEEDEECDLFRGRAEDEEEA
ncbi:MAG TPA: hypothetical protein PK336_08260, partial [Methanoculleus sp.]|nr:hypothetical protein [Methanoculleus sp.]